MRLPLAAVLLALAVPGVAAEHPCKPVPGLGCFYAPASAGNTLPLLVYIRGHHPRLGRDVPPGAWRESSRQAFDDYHLKQVADETGHAVFVTYRHDVPANQAAILKLVGASQLSFNRYVLAAHSGGNVGLRLTLAARGVEFERVFLLDLFYFTDTALSRNIQSKFTGRCLGFITPHGNVMANYETYFRPYAGGCKIEPLPNGDHNVAVNRCLAAYMNGAERCPQPAPERPLDRRRPPGRARLPPSSY